MPALPNTQQLSSDYPDTSLRCYYEGIDLFSTIYIPFYTADPGTNTTREMMYSTEWHIWHPKHVRKALTAAGFGLGIPSRRNCGFAYQRDVGHDFYYSGSLYARQSYPGLNTSAPDWDVDAIDRAATIIEHNKPHGEIALCFLPLMVLGLLFGMCFVCDSLARWRRMRDVRRVKAENDARCKEAKKERKREANIRQAAATTASARAQAARTNMEQANRGTLPVSSNSSKTLVVQNSF